MVFTSDDGIGFETEDLRTTTVDTRISDTQISNWDVAFGWGNHADQSYLKSETDPVFSASVASNITQTDINNWNSGSAEDPRISQTNINNWNTAYGWGNHSSYGYATTSWVTTYVSGNYQPAGNYLTSESDPTVPPHVKSITQANINAWNAAGGSTFPWVGNLAEFTTNGLGSVISLTSGNGRGAEINFKSGSLNVYLRTPGGNFELVNNAYSAVYFSVTQAGICTAGDFVATSDERLKDNIVTAPVGLIDSLKGREWDWKESGERGSGVVAQELEQVLPHLVHEDPNGNKTVSYNGLIAYLIEEVKALKAEVALLTDG